MAALATTRCVLGTTKRRASAGDILGNQSKRTGALCKVWSAALAVTYLRGAGYAPRHAGTLTDSNYRDLLDKYYGDGDRAAGGYAFTGGGETPPAIIHDCLEKKNLSRKENVFEQTIGAAVNIFFADNVVAGLQKIHGCRCSRHT